MKMTTCDKCGYKDVLKPHVECPMCNGGVMYA